MKKTEYVTFRTDAETRRSLEEIAQEKKWTLSFVIEEIVKDWLKNNKDNPKKLL